MQITFTWANGTTFQWGKNKSQITNPTKKQPPRPAQINYTEYPVANAELTQGLYHNSFPGLKLAGSMAYAPIATPVSFMGLPIPVTENEEAQKEIENLILKPFKDKISSIHTQSHREGTIWIWPFYDSESMRLVWEFIPDESVSDIIIDIRTKEVIKIVTDEELCIATDYNESITVRRKRVFTREKISVTWEGSGASGMENEVYRNPVGAMPVPFPNNNDGDGHRGYSDYERIVADLKAYADISEAELTMLSKFKPKMVQFFSTSVDEWLLNNGISTLAELDTVTQDFIMNKFEAEDTKFIFPQGSFEAYETALKRIYKKIVEGSPMPEILWGIATDGNHASAEKDMDTFVMYVKRKQSQHTSPWLTLYQKSIDLLVMAGRMRPVNDLDVRWNELSAISEETKAKIFEMFASGMSALINAAGITKEQVHSLWRKMYPEETEESFEIFKEQLAKMASHKQFKDADYVEVMGSTESDLDDDNEDPDNTFGGDE